MNLKPADIVFSQVVRAAAGHKCLRCGVYKPPTGKRGNSGMDCSHVYGRRHRTIRWAAENAKCLCHSCHRWWHENPTDSGQWFENLVGEGYMERLREKRDSMMKVTKSDERDIARHYRLQLKNIEERIAAGEVPPIPFESWQ